MLGLALLVASVGVADSVNPSTIVPGIWLATAPRARGMVFYTLGVFCVYLAGGIVLVFGPGPSLMAALRHVSGPADHALLTAGGIALLGFALVLWLSRHNTSGKPRQRRSYTGASAFALGAGIMAVELPTAFMYFGAISAILAARVAAPVELSLLVTYNLLFVAPLMAFLALRRLAGERGRHWIELAEAQIYRLGRAAVGCTAAAGGSALLAIGVAGLVASG